MSQVKDRVMFSLHNLFRLSWEIIRYTGDPRFNFCEAKCDLFQGTLGYLIIDENGKNGKKGKKAYTQQYQWFGKQYHWAKLPRKFVFIDI